MHWQLSHCVLHYQRFPLKIWFCDMLRDVCLNILRREYEILNRCVMCVLYWLRWHHKNATWIHSCFTKENDSMLLLEMVNKNVHADVSCDTQLHLKHIFFSAIIILFDLVTGLLLCAWVIYFFKFSNQYSIRLQSFSCELWSYITYTECSLYF